MNPNANEHMNAYEYEGAGGENFDGAAEEPWVKYVEYQGDDENKKNHGPVIGRMSHNDMV